MRRIRVILAGVVALLVAAAAVVWWPGAPSAPDAGQHGAAGPAPAPGAGGNAHSRAGQGLNRDFFAARRHSAAPEDSDPLLVHGLRDTLEAMMLEAGDASDPATLKQRLAALVGQHFPAALAARALALAERYVDYRVALGRLRSPPDATDPAALRASLQARHEVRLQFFDGPEYDALFAREAELDRYSLARLEIARNTTLTPAQRQQALQAAEAELPAERRAERSASTAHLDVAAQTAAFNAQNTDATTRHAARQAQYGEAAAQALGQLDREEQDWQQRLTQYSQARAQQGDHSAAVQQLRQQLFSAEEQLRIDAALALRKLNTPS